MLSFAVVIHVFCRQLDQLGFRDLKLLYIHQHLFYQFDVVFFFTKNATTQFNVVTPPTIKCISVTMLVSCLGLFSLLVKPRSERKELKLGYLLMVLPIHAISAR